jgi:hypothetical protein
LLKGFHKELEIPRKVSGAAGFLLKQDAFEDPVAANEVATQ